MGPINEGWGHMGERWLYSCAHTPHMDTGLSGRAW